jgi:hypothetical protein
MSDGPRARGIESPADELHRRVFTLLQDRWPAPVFGSYQQLQQISDLTAAVIDTVQTHGTPSFDNGRGPT